MHYTISQWLHSADKDHTVMTWGTLMVDKTIENTALWEETCLYAYTLPFFSRVQDTLDFHRWVHTNEHLLAYVKDTGSMRSSLEEVSNGKITGKEILDISPYQVSEGVYGFRVTSLREIPVELIAQAAELSLERAKKFLESNSEVPFATPEQCWQYDFHSISAALKSVSEARVDTSEISETVYSTKDRFVYVCDLRLLKPKLRAANDMITFSPWFSYIISQIIEQHLPSRLVGSIVIIGTFGCMTWMYLSISSATGDQKDIPFIHRQIIEILREKIDPETLSLEERIQLETLLENYEKYGQ